MPEQENKSGVLSSVVLHPDQKGGTERGEELSGGDTSKIGNLLGERIVVTMYGACRVKRMWQGDDSSSFLLVHTVKLAGIILRLCKLVCILCLCRVLRRRWDGSF